MTSWLATLIAMSCPRSSSTSATAKSSPAVTPAAVRSSPSLTWMASSSTPTIGYRCASCWATAQCVVTLRPSSKPAAARKNAPVHTDPNRRVFGRPSSQPIEDRHRRAHPRHWGSRQRAAYRSAGRCPVADRDRRRGEHQKSFEWLRAPPATTSSRYAALTSLHVRFREHIQRPGHVKQLNAGHRHDNDRLRLRLGPHVRFRRHLSVFDVLRQLQTTYPDLCCPRPKLTGERSCPDITEGITIPDSKLAREITEFVRDTETDAALQPFQPRLSLGRAGRHAAQPEVRRRAALRRRDVPRHRPDAGPQQPARALRGRRRECRPRLPAQPRHSRSRTSTRSGPRSRCTPRRAFRSTCTRSSRW